MKGNIKSIAPLTRHKQKMIRNEMATAHGDFKNDLIRRAFYKTHDSEVSQDLVQTTFMKTMIYLQKGGKVDLMRSFLNHILNGLIIDEYRKYKILSLDVLLEKGFEPETNDFERDINILDGKAVILLIPQLPKKYEQVLRLRYLNGLSLKEMSLITGLSENTLAVQAHRGMAKLRKLYLAQTSG